MSHAMHEIMVEMTLLSSRPMDVDKAEWPNLACGSVFVHKRPIVALFSSPWIGNA